MFWRGKISAREAYAFVRAHLFFYSAEDLFGPTVLRALTDHVLVRAGRGRAKSLHALNGVFRFCEAKFYK
jgi:hypothetical protein